MLNQNKVVSAVTVIVQLINRVLTLRTGPFRMRVFGHESGNGGVFRYPRNASRTNRSPSPCARRSWERRVARSAVRWGPPRRRSIAGVRRLRKRSEGPFPRRTVYAGMGVAEIRRLKRLEDENGKLKRLVADLTFDKSMLQDALRKVVRPVQRREVVRRYQTAFALSERRACRAMGFGPASHRYQPRRDPAVELRMRLKDLAESPARYASPGRRLRSKRRKGLPAPACPSSAGKLASEPQADLPPLQRGGSVDPHAQSEAKARLPQPGRLVCGRRHERRMDDALPGRRMHAFAVRGRHVACPQRVIRLDCWCMIDLWSTVTMLSGAGGRYPRAL